MKFDTVLALLVLIAFVTSVGGTWAQENGTRSAHDTFGDIFSHPRDKHYLPGASPSRGVLVDEHKYYDDLRGSVGVLEYRSGKQIIRREVWTKDNGESTGRLSIGPSF